MLFESAIVGGMKEKPIRNTVNRTVSFPRDLFARLDAMAVEGRTFSGVVVTIINKALKVKEPK